MRKTFEFKMWTRLVVILVAAIVCGSTEAENERLVFTQNSSGEKREYKIKTISFTKTGNADPESLNEFQ